MIAYKGKRLPFAGNSSFHKRTVNLKPKATDAVPFEPGNLFVVTYGCIKLDIRRNAVLIILSVKPGRTRGTIQVAAKLQNVSIEKRMELDPPITISAITTPTYAWNGRIRLLITSKFRISIARLKIDLPEYNAAPSVTFAKKPHSSISTAAPSDNNSDEEE